MGQDSVVGIATCYRLDSLGDQIPVGVKFSTRVQTDIGAHPVSYAMDTVSLQGVKKVGQGVNHPPPSSAEVKERVELYLDYPSVHSCQVIR